MTDREKVMKGLEYTKEMITFNPSTGEKIEPENLNELDKITYDACVDALELLKAQEPRVMTLEEVLISGDKLMWLEIKWAGVDGATDGFSFSPTSPYDDYPPDSFSISFQSGHIQARGLYGKQWRCWTSRPTDEQRKATPWTE